MIVENDDEKVRVRIFDLFKIREISMSMILAHAHFERVDCEKENGRDATQNGMGLFHAFRHCT